MGMDLGLGCPYNDLEPKDMAGQLAKGLMQTAVTKGPVQWPFGTPYPEEADEGKEAEQADGVKEAEGNPVE